MTVEKYYCDDPRCFFHEASNDKNKICEKCYGTDMATKPNDKLYDLYEESIIFFKEHKWFRDEIRDIDDDMTGNFKHDYKIYKDRTFEQYNLAMLGILPGEQLDDD